MKNIIENSKKIISLAICWVVLMSFFIANQPALAEFSRGTVRNGRFDSTKIVLYRAFNNPGGYIRKRELNRLKAFNPKVNVYNEDGQKIGSAKRDLRFGGLNVYDKNGKKVGFYRTHTH